MLRNIIANFIGKFWGILSNFLFIPLYIQILGFESYSIISFALVIGGIMAILDAGLTATLSREFARSDLSIEEKQKSFGTLETIYYLITLLTIVLLLLVSNTIAHNMITSKNFSSHEISMFIKIIAFDIGFQLLNRFYLGGFIGLEKQIKSNLLQVAWGFCRNGMVVIAILISPLLQTFFIWQALSTMIFAILSGILLRKQVIGSFTVKLNNIDKNVLKRNWKFASGMLLISLIAALNTQMDKLTISRFLPVESLGYYTLAVSLSMIIILLVNPISIAILPRLTNLFTDNKIEEASSFYNQIYLIVSILVFSILSSLIFFGQELIWIWTGNHELAKQSSEYIPIIGLAVAMLGLAIFPYNIAVANGYTKLNNIIGIISLFITLPGYWIATKFYGAIGAAFVYCFVQIIITISYIILINRRFFDEINLVKLFFKPMLMPFLISFVISYFLSSTPEFISTSRLMSLIWIIFSVILTMVISITILTPKKELLILKNHFKFNR